MQNTQIRHGHARHGAVTSIYQRWQHMLNRCRDPRHKSFKNYGARGITVCDRWKVFENFLADMQEPPIGLTLERIDTNGNYEPSNCRWATRADQSRNRRGGLVRSTRMLTFNKETLCVSDWAKKTGIPRRLIHDRIFRMGWPIEKALTKPADKRFTPR